MDFVSKVFILKLRKTLQKRGQMGKADFIFRNMCQFIYASTRIHPYIIITVAINNGLPTLLLRKDKGKKQRETDKYIMPLLIQNESTRLMYSIS
jgi:hypothetical protein